MQELLKIGSRGSPLALVQARLVQRLMGRAAGMDAGQYKAAFPIKVYTTTGDVLTGRLAVSGGKGLFVKELDEALASGEIDMAVHSMKDVPTTIDAAFEIPTILPREDVRDAFISLKYDALLDMPKGAILGTASLRRQAQAARLRPDLKIVLLRGNVGTRLAKLEQGVCEATFLASAGLTRLGQTEVIKDYISADDMLPAPAQGAVGVQIRAGHNQCAKYLAPLHCAQTHIAITAERALLKALDGSCRTPIAALAQIKGETLRLRAQALSPDGRLSYSRDETVCLMDGPIKTAKALGYALGMSIKDEAGDTIKWDM